MTLHRLTVPRPAAPPINPLGAPEVSEDLGTTIAFTPGNLMRPNAKTFGGETRFNLPPRPRTFHTSLAHEPGPSTPIQFALIPS